MARYILKRLLSMILILIAAAFLIFTILYLTPGEPARMLLGGTATEDEVRTMAHTLGTDRSYMEQLGEFMINTFVRFKFGNSWLYKVPVMQEMNNRLPHTITIGLISMILTALIGFGLGIIAGTHEGKWQDSVTMAITMLLVSMPNFWLALLMIILFSVNLGWLPAYGIDSWTSYIMPIVASTLGGVAMQARQMRSAVLDVVRADYVTTARAKGQTERKITMRHILPNAAMPAITMLGGHLGGIVGGSAIIESVFSIPGVGLYMLAGINARDYPVVRTCVLFFALVSSIAMILTDIGYAYLDPRIKARYTNRKRKEEKEA
ncbi:MAG: ABC transporter permease [Clostridia bacterium]|nr:ABC transporter permease [Clostridia bacterium]